MFVSNQKCNNLALFGALVREEYSVRNRPKQKKIEVEFQNQLACSRPRETITLLSWTTLTKLRSHIFFHKSIKELWKQLWFLLKKLCSLDSCYLLVILRSC